MKKFRCVPIAIGLPIIFGVLMLICLVEGIFFEIVDEPDGVVVGIVCAVFSGILALGLLPAAIRRVEIGESIIICKALLSRDTFTLEYEKCNVGMDYHVQNGGKVWWIYLCYDYPLKYQSKSSVNRINSIKIHPGFIRIMYSDEVYDALLQVLPKRQRTGLITARRCAGFEKQGNIIF